MPSNEYGWYMGKITHEAEARQKSKGNFQVLHINHETRHVLPFCVNIRNKNGRAHFTIPLLAENWGPDKKWVVVEKEERDYTETQVSEHPFINRQIRKEFDGDMYTGSVKEVISVLYDGDGEDKAVLIFKVKYEDNDEDELEYDECERFLVPVEGEVGVGC